MSGNFLKKKYQWSTSFSGEDSTISVAAQPEIYNIPQHELETDSRKLVKNNEFLIKKVENSTKLWNESQSTVSSVETTIAEEPQLLFKHFVPNSGEFKESKLSSNLKQLDIISKNHNKKLKNAYLLPHSFVLNDKETDKTPEDKNSNEIRLEDDMSMVGHVGTCKKCKRQFAVRMHDITKKLRLQCGGSTWLSIDILAVDENKTLFYCRKCNISADCPQCEDFQNDYDQFIGRLIYLPGNKVSQKNIEETEMSQETQDSSVASLEFVQPEKSISETSTEINNDTFPGEYFLVPPECPLKIPLDTSKTSLALSKNSNESKSSLFKLKNSLQVEKCKITPPRVTDDKMLENDSTFSPLKQEAADESIFKIPRISKVNQQLQQKCIRIVLKDCEKMKHTNVKEKPTMQDTEEVVIVKEIFYKENPKRNTPKSRSDISAASSRNPDKKRFLNGNSSISRKNVGKKLIQNVPRPVNQGKGILRNKTSIQMMDSKLNGNPERSNSQLKKQTKRLQPAILSLLRLSKTSSAEHKTSQRSQLAAQKVRKNDTANPKYHSNSPAHGNLQSKTTVTKILKQKAPGNSEELTGKRNQSKTNQLSSPQIPLSEIQVSETEVAKISPNLPEKTKECTNVSDNDVIPCTDSKNIKEINHKVILSRNRPASAPAACISIPNDKESLENPQTLFSMKHSAHSNFVSDLIFPTELHYKDIFKNSSDNKHKCDYRTVSTQTEGIPEIYSNDEAVSIPEGSLENRIDKEIPSSSLEMHKMRAESSTGTLPGSVNKNTNVSESQFPQNNVTHNSTENISNRSNPPCDISNNNSVSIQQNHAGSRSTANFDSIIAGTNVNMLKKLAEGYSLFEIAVLKKRVQAEMKSTIDSQFQAACQGLFGSHHHYDLDKIIKISPTNSRSSSVSGLATTATIPGKLQLQQFMSKHPISIPKNVDPAKLEHLTKVGYWYIATAQRKIVHNQPIENNAPILLNIQNTANDSNYPGCSVTNDNSSLPLKHSRVVQVLPPNQILRQGCYPSQFFNANKSIQRQEEPLPAESRRRENNFSNVEIPATPKQNSSPSQAPFFVGNNFMNSPSQIPQQNEGLMWNPLTMSIASVSPNDSINSALDLSPPPARCQIVQNNLQKSTEELQQRNVADNQQKSFLTLQDRMHRQFALRNITRQRQNNRGNSCPCSMCNLESPPRKRACLSTSSMPQETSVIRFCGDSPNDTDINFQGNQSCDDPTHDPRLISGQTSVLQQQLLQNDPSPSALSRASPPEITSPFSRHSIILNPNYENVLCSNPFDEAAARNVTRNAEKQQLRRVKQRKHQLQKASAPLIMNSLRGHQYQNINPNNNLLPQPRAQIPAFRQQIPQRLAYLPESVAQFYRAKGQFLHDSNKY